MSGFGHIYEGVVAHRRLRPAAHSFSYRVFSLLLDIDRIDEASNGLRFFSRNAFNLFSFFDRDHAAGDDGPLPARIRAMLWGAGFRGDGRILLLCYPRILGYVFNPLAVYYCHAADGRLEAVIYEVRNTFGETHSYFIAVEGDAPRIRQFAEKAFYVSPFMDMDQRYAFDLNRPGEALSVAIRNIDSAGLIFSASFKGARRAMTDRALISTFFRYPLMTLKIIAAIHWEAARLFVKGLKFRRRPTAPARASVSPSLSGPRRNAA